MLQIFVYKDLPRHLSGWSGFMLGPRTDSWLDLAPGTVLNIESTSEIFDDDFLQGEFSLPIEVPWTDNNRRNLGFVERLQNFVGKDIFFRCDVYDDGFPEMVGAKLTILERTGRLDYRQGSFSATISGAKGLFGSIIKNKKLTDLELGGMVSAPLLDGHNSRTFATALMKGDYPQFSHVRFAPVAIENYIDTDRKDYSIEFLAKNTVNTVVVTGSGTDDWEFGKPSNADENVPAASTTLEYYDFRTVPFLQLKHVLKACFTEFGYNLTGDFLVDTDFDDLFLFNNWSIDFYWNVVPWVGQDLNLVAGIEPKNHVPDMLVKDFIRETCKFFNMFPRFLPNNEIQLVYKKNQITNRQIMSLNPFAGSTFNAIPYNSDNSKGYTIKYNFDPTDQYVSDIVKKLDGKTVVGTVFLKSGLDDLVSTGFTTDSIALVTSENLYYVVVDTTTSPVTWEVFCENIDEKKYGEGEKAIELNMTPMCQYVEKDTGTDLLTRRNYVGCRLKGSYRNFAGVRVKNPFGLRCFYIKKIETGGVSIPMSFNHNTYADGTAVENFTLAFDTEKGMDLNFHRTWQLMLLRSELVKLAIRMDKKILRDVRNAEKFELMNVVALEYREERSIPMRQSMQIELATL